MADFTQLDNERDALVNLLNQAKDVLGDSPTAQAAIVSITDSTGGTGNDTLVAVSGSGDDAEINNNFADLAAKIQEILVALRAIGLIAT